MSLGEREWLDYGTSVINLGSYNKETWTNALAAEKHRLSHKSGSSIRLRVKRKNGRWLATIEIDPEVDDYNQIKRLLENNGWKAALFRGTRTCKTSTLRVVYL